MKGIGPSGISPKHTPMLSPSEFKEMSVPQGFTLDAAPVGAGELPPGFELDEDKYGGVSGSLKTAALGAADSATLGLSNVALTKTGLVSPETIKGLQEENPVSNVAGQIAGFFAPTGAAGLLGKAGKATYAGVKALTAIRAAEEMGAVGKLLKNGSQIGAQALGSAVEGSLYAGTQTTLNEFALGDPDLNAEKILSNYGQAAVFGGATGAILKSASLGLPLAAKSGANAISKVKQILAGSGHGDESLISKALGKVESSGKLSDQFMNRAKNLDVDQQAELVKGVTDQLNIGKNNFNTALKDLNSTLRPAERDALIETANGKEVLGATQDVINDINKMQAEVKAHPDRYSGGLLKDLEDKRIQIANNLKKDTPGGRFDLLKEIKQSAAEYGHGATPTIELQNSKGLFKQLSQSINEKLTNPDIFGMAGASEAAHNSFLSEIYSLVSPKGRAKTDLQKEFKKLFLGTDNNFDAGKMKKFLAKGGPEGDRARELIDHWFSLQEKMPEHFENTIANVPNDLWDHSKFSDVMTSLKNTKGNLGEAAEKYQTALENAKGRKLGLKELLIGGGLGAVHPLLGGAVFAMDAASRPLEYINKLAEVERIVGKATDSLEKGVKSVFTPTLKGAGKIKAPIIKSMMPANQDNHQKVRNDLSQLTGNPGLMIDALDHASSHLNSVAPSMADGLRQGLMRGSMYLAAKLPGNQPRDAFSSPYEPSQAEISKFERYHEVVENPYVALSQIKQGILVPETIETLAAVYPRLYVSMKNELMNQAIEMHAKEKPIPYQLKQQISMFVGEPIDSSLKQQSIMMNQASFVPKQQEQPMPQQSGKTKPLTIADRTSPQQDQMES